MTTVDSLCAAVAAAVPDEQAAEQARKQQDRLTKPPGSLARLEELSVWLSGVRGLCPPGPVTAPRVVVFAGDHGVARAGVSAYPAEVTAQMVGAVRAGIAAVSVVAAEVGASVRVEDLAVDADTPPEVSRYKVRRGSGRIDLENALSREEAERALLAGAAIAAEEIAAGADLLIAGEVGIGNTTPSAALVARLAGADPGLVTGPGTGLDAEGVARKTAVVRAAVRRAGELTDPVDVLAAIGGADLAAIAGFLLGAAAGRTPAVLDGVIVGAAALVAHAMAPSAVRWWLAGHRSSEPAHDVALRRLGLEPVLDLGLHLGEGSGAVAVVPLLRVASAILGNMRTFEEAGVSDRPEG
ncbi:nicotinate-nucleotide--dimethylbenzimidazole phosphoribosyltransferase [Amycolatopsis sp. MtRt-6]|uniref:nicotinate-nucleotide--dimethylbenzimidazole phosphoribosyltransferase n=1 Tax=Amycolatopsis sp. MtRt-6 TaxID=2792782 RepID=UPI001A8F5819|nr:nicotinate-nucleotide--dimethylbenzimidazole phosphoribosyltransferase [Amycolatopsis sp. MtRt-6]